MSHSMPGGYTEKRTIAPREILWNREHPFNTIPIPLDGTNGKDGGNTGYTYEIRAGWLMGRITATGLWVPCKRTKVSGNTESSSASANLTTFTVDNAAAFIVGDVLVAGPHTSKTITAIDYVNNKITVNDNINLFDDQAVYVNDGSQTARGVLYDFTKLRNDENTAAENKSAQMLYVGSVKYEMLLGDKDTILADTTSAALLKGIHVIKDGYLYF